MGWRIEYHIITPADLASTVRNAAVYKGVSFSDHATLTIDYESNS